MAVPAGWESYESMDNVSLPGGTNCPHFSAANLTAAVSKFNADVAAGKGDTVFGTSAATLVFEHSADEHSLFASRAKHQRRSDS